MIIKCTKKLLDELKIKPEERPEEDLLCSWHATLVEVCGKKTVVLINDKNNYFIVLSGLIAENFNALGDLIIKAIRDTLRQEGLKDEVIDRFIASSGEIVYSKTSSRSLTSKLSNACRQLSQFEDLTEGDFVSNSALSIKLSKLILGDDFKIYKDMEAFDFIEEVAVTIDEPVQKVTWFATGKNKIGRNAPCPCGSGRKYKKCCLG